MNHYFPEWNFEPDLPAATQRKPLIEEEELVELLWENGQVVLNNRTNKNQGVDQNESRKSSKSCNEPSTNILKRLGQENELVSWNHHCDQVDDPFEKELSSFILPEFIPVSSNSSSLIHDSPIESYKFSNFDGSQISHICANSSQPPQLQDKNLGDIVCNNNIRKRGLNNNNHSCPTSNGGGSMKMRANSGKTVGSSHCGSNQVIYDAEDDGFAGKFTSQSERSNEREAITGSLSSGGSGFTTGNQSTGTNSRKRKCRETENSEFQSEDVLLESIPRKKTAQEFVGTRKSRASEVHNLSERRRRDRINEKMRALQELLPRSNQTDKASMLDEAIQYMKSLQLQLQMMWMGSQMAPMMFPTYMSRLELGIGSPLMPNLQSAMNLTRLPLMDQARANQAAIINYQNQLQNCNFSDQYGAYIGFYPPVHSTNQQLNMYNNPYGLNMAQHNQTFAPPGDANIRPPA